MQETGVTRVLGKTNAKTNAKTNTKTNAKPNEVGSRWRGRTTERSECPNLRGRSGVKFVRTKRVRVGEDEQHNGANARACEGEAE